jgi:hypothetical protein
MNCPPFKPIRIVSFTCTHCITALVADPKSERGLTGGPFGFVALHDSCAPDCKGVLQATIECPWLPEGRRDVVVLAALFDVDDWRGSVDQLRASWVVDSDAEIVNPAIPRT